MNILTFNHLIKAHAWRAGLDLLLFQKNAQNTH